MKKRWKCSKFGINALTFIFTLFGILNTLGISYYTRYGWQEPTFKEGMYHLIIALLIYKIGNYICDTTEPTVYICSNCEEAYSEEDYKKEKTCIKCDGNLETLKKHYGKSNKS